jgi:alkaline phosphatase D
VGDEGWTVVGDAQGGSSVPTHVPTGGVPGGYLSADDDTTGGTWFWEAPDPYLGDRSGFYGGTLTYHLRQSATSSQFEAPEVVLGNGSLQLRYDATHPGTEWTAYEVPLRATENWTVVGSGTVATEGQLRSVLADLDTLRIRGEYRSGSDTGDLDAVALRVGGQTTPFAGPVPGTGAADPPADHDADGLYEDVDGDGDADFDDAIALAFADVAELAPAQADALDFDGDGDVDFDDAIELAFRV